MISFNGRYGFEEPRDAQSKLVSLRAGLSLVQSFSPRLHGSLGFNYVSQKNTTPQIVTATGTQPETNQTTDTVDSTIGFEYNLTRAWTLNANYSYSRETGTESLRDYYRNRVFVGAEYVF